VRKDGCIRHEKDLPSLIHIESFLSAFRRHKQSMAPSSTPVQIQKLLA